MSRLLRACAATAVVATLPLTLGACRASTQASTAPAPAPQYPYPQQPYGQPGYAQQPYPQQPYPQQPYPQQPYPQQPQPQPQPQPPSTGRPMLAPLVGLPAQQQEVQSILAELINALPPDRQALVRGIPLVFDPTPEVNAFAGCDEQGAPFLAATRGILEAVDAIAQTKATDELFGTQTYEAYTNTVIPQIIRSEKASAALPAGMIPANYGPDPRRWSRARELFDDVIAFTFGHELAHHYLGHTGCAKGQGGGRGIDPMLLGRLISNAIPTFNQVNEGASDTAGCENALTAGRARRPQYAWSETGGVLLLDYFARIERAAGGGFLNPMNVLKTHPYPGLRVGGVQFIASQWRARNPG